jgi:hypothetical protein
MHFAHRLLSAAALALLSASSFASDGVYTSPAAFLSHVAAGAYTESFDGLSDTTGSFSSGAFAYTLSSSGGLYASGDFVGTNLPDFALTITFTSGNVTALGANFFATDFSDAFQAVPMTLTLSDGTVVVFTPSAAASYRGFTSDTTIASLVIGAPGVSLYSGLDNLTVGIAIGAVPAVPEPTTWALMGLALAGVVAARRLRA